MATTSVEPIPSPSEGSAPPLDLIEPMDITEAPAAAKNGVPTIISSQKKQKMSPSLVDPELPSVIPLSSFLSSYSSVVSLFNDAISAQHVNPLSPSAFHAMAVSVCSTLSSMVPTLVENLPPLTELVAPSPVTVGPSTVGILRPSPPAPIIPSIAPLPTGPSRKVFPSLSQPPRGSYASIARQALSACSDESQRSSIAIKHLSAPSPMLRKPMKQRLLPHDAELHGELDHRLAQLEIVYFRGIRRMAFSGLREMFGALGFAPRELLHFSFLGNGITAILCRDDIISKKLISTLADFPQFSRVCIIDPSLPLPRMDNSFPDSTPSLLHQCRQAYISRVVREIQMSRDLLVATFLQREVPTCSEEITSIIRPPRVDSHVTGVPSQ